MRTEELDKDTVILDGLDEAILGVCPTTDRLIYSIKGILKILQERDGMTLEEADEFFSYNIEGCALTEDKSPIYCNDFIT